jgi:hypothetical protein
MCRKYGEAIWNITVLLSELKTSLEEIREFCGKSFSNSEIKTKYFCIFAYLLELKKMRKS